MKYRIFITHNFTKNLEEILCSGWKKIFSKLETSVFPQLRNEPHFGPHIKRLRNWKPLTWRYRIGDWRFFYQIDEESQIVYMTAVYNRKEAYRTPK